MSKAIKRSIKNVVNGYTSAQVRVRNATSNEPTGPTTGEMEDLVDLTYEHTEFLDVMDMIDKRLNDKGKNWRHVAKALTVLDFLVRCGSENVVRWSRDNLYIIKTLREFQYIDEDGRDQGSIVRVKAKELTSLLRDEERLREERGLRARKRGNNRRRRGSDDEETEEERLMREALEESKRTAEEEERKRRAAMGEDDGLETALRLSREEEEARRMRLQNGNLLDLNDAPQQTGVMYDVFGNPIYPPGSPEALYQQQQAALLAQQQQEEYMRQLQLQQQQQLWQQQQLEQQQALWAQQQQQEYLQQQYLQQQYLQQQQQQQQALQTGSNNPFAMNSQPEPEPQPQPVQQTQPEPEPQPQQTQPLKKVPTGSQLKNEQFSELNQLLAQGTGIDTFGNEGATRIPAQYTRTSQFLNSSGTGIGQTQHSIGNPFLKQQYTGVASTSVVPAHTGYGFGNQPSTSQGNSSQNNSQSLIDM